MSQPSAGGSAALIEVDAMPALSIIIPAYNEAARLGTTITRVLDYLSQQSFQSELIVVDDGSTDGTAELACGMMCNSDRIQTRLIRVEHNRGKGNAVRTGMLAARAPLALFTDADLSTPISEAGKLIGLLENGRYDIVFGSRAADRALTEVKQPWRRRMTSRIFNGIVKMITHTSAADTQCGFKLFRMRTCRPIIQAAATNGFAFDVELLYLARLARLQIKECGVNWTHAAGSKVSLIRDSLRMLREVVAIRYRDANGDYSYALKSARMHAESFRKWLSSRRFLQSE